MSDSAQLNGASQSTVRLPAAQPHSEVDKVQFDAPEALLRLLVGGMLVGADELRIRLRVWDAATRTTSQAASHEMATAPTPPASWRYALIGMLFESETRVRRQLSAARARLERLADEAESYYDEMYEPDVRQTPLDPLLARLDELFGAAEETIDRWAERGRSEAERGVRMARLASPSVVDELLDYMARNPEVRELIERQASSMAEVAVDEVRGRAATADLWVERLAHRVLRRPGSETHLENAGAVNAPQPASETEGVAPSSTPQAPKPANRARASQAAPSVETPASDGSDG